MPGDDDPFIAEIFFVPFDFAPAGFAKCNGQLLSIQQNQALFTLLGTTYGGNGVTNFALPDLRGRVPRHEGPGHTLGDRGGAESVTLSVDQMPAHTHPVPATSATATSGTPLSGGLLAATNPTTTGDVYAAPPSASNLATMHPVSTGDVGGNQGHNNQQPYLALNAVIALAGVFPS